MEFVYKLIDRTRDNVVGLLLKYRLGKSKILARIIFKILSFFDSFSFYENTGKIQKNHHFVPVFLLKQFKTDGAELWRYSKINKTLLKESIRKKVCSLSDYYILSDKFGEQTDYIENKYFGSTIEKFGSRIIYRLLEFKDNFELTHLEESILAVFLANQIVRVPAFHKQVKKLLLYLLEMKIISIKDLENIDYIQEVIIQNKFKISFDDFIQYTPHINFDGGKNHIHIISILFGSKIAKEIFFSKTSHILLSPHEWEFVISDNPVTIVNLTTGEYITEGCWFDISNPEILIFFPISKTKCIFYSSRVKPKSKFETMIAMVHLANHSQFCNAHEFIHSHSKSLIQKYLKYYKI